MNKTCIRVFSVTLGEYTEFANGEHSVFNGIALIHEALTDLGYHVMNRHITHGDDAMLYPIRLSIQTTLTGLTTGIPTDVEVVVKPSGYMSYAVIFFK